MGDSITAILQVLGTGVICSGLYALGYWRGRKAVEPAIVDAAVQRVVERLRDDGHN